MKLKFEAGPRELFFQGNYCTNKEFFIDLNWLFSLKPTTKNGLSYFQKKIKTEQVKHVVNRLDSAEAPKLGTDLGAYIQASILDVQNYFKTIDYVAPFYSYYKENRLDKKLIAFEVQDNNFVNEQYYPAALFDINAEALACPRGPIAMIVKDSSGRVVFAVAAIVPKGTERPKYILNTKNK